MNLQNQQLEKVAALFNARNIRERILIASCVVIFIFSLWQFLFFDSLVLSQNKLAAEIDSRQSQINSVYKQYQLLANAQAIDPDSDIKRRIKLAQTHMDKLNQQLALKMKGLVNPGQMATILERVLSQKTDLRFVRLQNLKPAPLLVNAPEQNKQRDLQTTQPVEKNSLANIGVYKHGLEMEFTGSFLATLDYLKQLEQLSWNFYWDDVQFDVVDYPRSKVIIRVHTLSLREGWLGV